MMQITAIKESGTNNILRWAITNGADIKSDIQLQSVINDETFYLVTISNVNLLELFRLTQTYREKVRILEEKQYAIPDMKAFKEAFPGSETINGQTAELAELVKYSAEQLINLVLQMQADTDIIRPETGRLFLPMISRQFNVQIPVSFMDIITYLPQNQASILFNTDYPNNIDDVLINNEDKTLINMLMLSIIKTTSIIRYDNHYNELVNMTKYLPLKKAETNRLYKFKLLGFHKYDNISRGEVRCDMFKPDKKVLTEKMKHIARINSPLEIDFAVQLPIQYMQMIESFFAADILKVQYESPMSEIIDCGIDFNDFITQEFSEGDDESLITEYNNSIQSYRTRINEINTTVLNTIGVLNNSQNDVDITSAFALLPSIYSTRAVFTINMNYADGYINHYDPLVVDMFYQMLEIGSSIIEDLSNQK